jgi:hypothetical protein
MGKISAYERIQANIGADGTLPHDFTLEPKHTPNQIEFMPGARDGIGVFHINAGSEEKLAKKVVNLLKKYFITANTRYISQVETILTNSRALSLIDPILQNLRDNHKGIDPNKMVNLSINLVKASGNVELIKIMVGLLGLFDLGNIDEVSKVISTLALYGDFTLFAVVTASNWPNGNRTIFQIAKSAVGWGKIHAVERLEPETAEIREWILRSGCSNAVMDAYLGLTCAVKGDLISVLRQDSIDTELFDSAAIIIDALLDEGPVAGISEYEHAREALSQYLSHAKQHVTGIRHLWRILNLRDWAEDAEADYKGEILAGCAEIINKPGWVEKVVSAVKKRNDIFEFFYASNVAERLDIDISDELFNVVKAEPLKYYLYMPQLLKKPDMASKIITLCETVLPLEEMAEGMGDDLFADKFNQEHQCLDFILPGLAEYPLQGVKLILTGLNSRVVRGRNMACRAMSGWVRLQSKPLSEVSPELYSEIVRIYKIEVNEQTKESMKKLIDGGAEDAL